MVSDRAISGANGNARMKVIATLLLFAISALHAADTQLPAGVRSALDLRHVPPETLSIYVADLDSGQTVLNWRGDVPRNPASTMKVLTTLVALDILGPTYRWRTDVFVQGDLKAGRLEGDLLIKGHGDPFMVTERVWQMLRNIRRAGINEITGDLLIDDSWFEVDDYDPAAFDRQPLRAYNVAPNALLMNFKVVRYHFEPDLLTNTVIVSLEPPLKNLRVENRLHLVTGRCRGYQRGITITTNKPLDEVTLSGNFPSGCMQYSLDRSALSHNDYVYGLFRSLWLESGGVFSGGWHNVVVEKSLQPILSFESLPLGEIIASVNKHSNNVMARNLLLTLAAEVNGYPGTEESGIQVISKWLVDNKLESDEIVIENGAGLSRKVRITAKHMGALLKYAWRQPYMPEYLASLSLAGLDGTLKERFPDAGLAGSARLKTGSIDHVTAIAGYLQSRTGRRFAVVVLQNHPDIHRGPGEEVQDALLRWLYEQ